ncbi:MAG: EthD family reductase [Deltaproteobacteria bacterium]|jgi:uncharacterized protein (TIGR02118 family)|nr:EthD family reductase [Deltaproteobacteria bacterium]MBT4003450.1 EthD family reductase [Chloroflexota bacterium]MBT4269502.1 EthD family reductase [Deltaproteobacteria bacterium]MBT4642957.1 EthD family reductase [Deltaproteobacteria bacterium]MBT6504733.1 EthD family reductase [Deltaproteobacteria bacterium]
MIRVSVLYPFKEGGKFDHDYYRDKHIPLVKDKLGSALREASIDKGIAGGAPDAPLPFSCIGYLIFNSIEDFQQAFGPVAGDIMGDIPNYTDIEPILQISEIVQ